jgi:hypothetical protein
VQLSVSEGLFNVLLGDTTLSGMTEALDASVFSGTDRYLRVWFSTSAGGPFTQLGDQRISSVPFALQAQEAANADTLDGSHASDFAQAAHDHDDRYYTDDELQTSGLASVHWGNLTNVPSGLADGDDDTTYTAGEGLILVGTEFSADTSYLQRRVTGSCASGNAIRVIKADGTVTCQPIAGEAGDITAVYAGDGLTGGGETGAVTLAVDFAGTGSATTVARSDHDHDGTYSQVGHVHDHDSLSGLGDDDHTQYFHLSQDETVTDRPAFNGGDGSNPPFTVDSNYLVTNLNADLLDGSHASAFAAATHDHDAAYINDNAGEVGDADVPSGALSPDRISGTAWTSTNDGPGSGLDADTLDGSDSSAFAAATHGHWGDSWSGSGTGLSLSGGSIGLDATGTTYGVYGKSDSTSGRGVYGLATAMSGYTYGVYGKSNSTSGTGVYGTAPKYGVRGYASATSGAAYGVYGLSDSTIGRGVYGYASATSGDTYGVYGWSESTSGRGVYGYASATSGTTYGVYGKSDSSDGTGVEGTAPKYGVYGYATADSGYTYGVYGWSESTSGRGVYGKASATSGNTYGVYGESESTSGRGVYGYASATSGDTYGVYGWSESTSGRGVYGLATATSGTTYGVYGKSYSSDGYGGYFVNSASGGVGLYARGKANTDADLVLGGTSSTDDDGRIYSDPAYTGSDILLYSNDEVWIYLDEDDNEDAEFRIYNGANTNVFKVEEDGDMTATGTKAAVVDTRKYGTRKMYAIESPEVWFEDFGSAQLKDGVVVVEIDPVFAETVNLEVGYHVFLIPVGGWAPLYVTNKTPTSFEVRDADGKANIAFDYRIVAKRLGYEDLRMEPVVLE